MKIEETEPYIEMCKKSKHIQESWQPERGDYFEAYGKIDIIEREEIDHKEHHYLRGLIYQCADPRQRCTWLPTIEQLERMIADKYKKPQHLLLHLHLVVNQYAKKEGYSVIDGKFIPGSYRPVSDMYWYKFTSIKEIFLAFVMYRDFQQKWHFEKEEWEKVKYF